jgi:uncharacterized protein YlaI
MEKTYVCENCKMEINIKERVNHTLKCLGNFLIGSNINYQGSIIKN